ncbi:MAG: hypothetical protein IPJ19_02340 [Planctomycetes bacterium]|nr:hypothetical protein [Planctomycetota bacterium]
MNFAAASGFAAFCIEIFVATSIFAHGSPAWSSMPVNVLSRANCIAPIIGLGTSKLRFQEWPGSIASVGKMLSSTILRSEGSPKTCFIISALPGAESLGIPCAIASIISWSPAMSVTCPRRLQLQLDLRLEHRFEGLGHVRSVAVGARRRLARVVVHAREAHVHVHAHRLVREFDRGRPVGRDLADLLVDHRDHAHLDAAIGHHRHLRVSCSIVIR